MRAWTTILLLIISNSFMTLAWYGHLKYNTFKGLERWGILGIILTSWAIAFLEYCFMIPANRIGSTTHGGVFNLLQLKVIQEVISIVVFVLFMLFFFKQGTLSWNHYIAFLCLVLAVYFVFK